MRMSLLTAVAAPILFTLVAGCASKFPPQPVGVGTLGAEEGHAKEGRFLNMGQPSAEDLTELAGQGYSLVLDMRTEAEDRGFDEAATVSELGMTYKNLGFRAPETLTTDLLAEAIESIQASSGKVLLHCKSGNRSAAVWMAWRMTYHATPYETALDEAHQMGLRNDAYAEQVRAFVEGQ